jgi:hypothetical protein
MANTNDFLPFGIGAGANVLDQASYAGLAARSTGFQAGVAPSIQVNKVWRQAAVISAVLGKFINDIGGLDALDNGDLDALLLSFERSLQNGKMTYAVAGGTANALTVTLTPAPASYTAGLEVKFKAAVDSTGTTTINVNGLGAKALSPLFRLKAGAIYTAIYDGTGFINQQAEAGNSVLTAVSRFRCATTGFSLPVNVETSIPITSFSDDGQTDFTLVSNTLVCQRAGRYQILANFGSSTTSAIAAMTLGTKLNGAELISSSIRETTNIINVFYGGGGDIKDLVPGDVIRPYAYQDGTAGTISLNFNSGVAITRLTSA